MQLKLKSKLKSKIKLKGVQILALGFIGVILIGAILLSLPISSKSGEATNFLDAAFVATSAVCITGLTPVVTATHWSAFGHVVMMFLIEIGALGFIAFFTILSIIIGKKITLKDRLLVQESMNTFSIQGLVRMIKYIFGFALSIQFAGFLLLSTQFVPEYGLKIGLFNSLFHAVSAFGNAGFDLFVTSLVQYNSNAVVILVIAAEIIIAGIGFTVLTEIYESKNLRKISVHAKLVIITTLILLLGGAILFFSFEYNNPNTIGNMSLGDKILNSIFASVTPRTAGFFSVNLVDMTTASKFLTILLMFIGGSPGSTAGGIKTVTIAILVLTVVSVIRGREDTECFGRRFSKEVIYKAFTIFFLELSLLMIVPLILSITEQGVPYLDLLYETASALGTVGLTLDLTPNLTSIGKLLIMSMMYIGRVGPLTVILSLRKNDKNNSVKYPEGKILIG